MLGSMAVSIPDRIASLQLHYSSSPQPRFCVVKYLEFQNTVFFPRESLRLKGRTEIRYGPARASLGPPPVGSNGKTRVSLETILSRVNETVAALPPIATLLQRSSPYYPIVYLSIGFALLVIILRQNTVIKNHQTQRGSVINLVKRGHLRSARRGIFRSDGLKYDDPFNNPLVKKGSNETMEICGKVYRLAPVTLTKEEQSLHQKRRSHAYNWKRPTIYLKEGDEVPSDVDPDAVKWIPANHPFATTVSDIDEKVAQENVYQKDGVPFRIRAEHEALQKKLETLQNEQMVDSDTTIDKQLGPEII
ncbi:Multiple chloroplast division site 1 [Zostera marina]|uniref:Multiple chloroplast division site 1 n=1 Tax=Zostera marina TaxID=29655 RepID=A0A0K9PT49_ZOSMR|nr:Multiple chloroplast division site 1 [Zostera marina]